MASATSRSAAPAARVSSASTARPLRFSISTWPMKQSWLCWPLPLRNSRASSSVAERWVSLERFSPLKSRSPLRPGAGSSPEPSFGRKLFRLAPRLDQRAVDGEVLAGKQALDARIVENGTEELARDFAAQQPVAVLGEHGDVPHRIVDAETDEPAEQTNCSPTAPSAAAPSGRCRTPAATAPAAAAPAGSTAGRSAHRWPRNRRPAWRALHRQSPGSSVTDADAAPAPPDGHS